jgi:uncharacterized membrane protein
MHKERAPDGGEVLFQAELRPNRSLSPRGFGLLMIALVAVSFVAGIAFVSMGAWPVFGFFGLDVLLLYWAFKASYRSGNLYETLKLTDETLEVRRVHPSGGSQVWRLPPYWLRVLIDEPPEHHSQLVLRSHGRDLTVGSFLTPEERVEVAGALRDALDVAFRRGRAGAHA